MTPEKMMRGIALLLTLALVPMTQTLGQDKPAVPAEQYRILLKEFQDAEHAHLNAATTDEERKQGVARMDTLGLRCLELAEANPKDPIALDVLTEVVTQEWWLDNNTSHPGWGKESRQARAITLLLRDHLQSNKLGETCNRVHGGFRRECETFLRTVLEKSPHREVQGAACLRLAQFLASRRQKLELLANQPELARRYEGLFGKGYLEELRCQDRAKVMLEAETLYEQASEKYGDVKLPYDMTVGQQAQTELLEIRHFAVGKEAPDIEGADQYGQQFKLSDYRKKVVLLYFWTEF